jgi:hypothetical protein
VVAAVAASLQMVAQAVQVVVLDNLVKPLQLAERVLAGKETQAAMDFYLLTMITETPQVVAAVLVLLGQTLVKVQAAMAAMDQRHQSQVHQLHAQAVAAVLFMTALLLQMRAQVAQVVAAMVEKVCRREQMVRQTQVVAVVAVETTQRHFQAVQVVQALLF